MFGINDNKNDQASPVLPTPLGQSEPETTPLRASDANDSPPLHTATPAVQFDPPSNPITDENNFLDRPAPLPVSPVQTPETPKLSSEGPQYSEELLQIKQEALQNLTPLVGKLEQTPEEKFKTTMMMLQASDNPDLVKEAYAAANKITDEKYRAQALLDVVNEINYFTHHDAA